MIDSKIRILLDYIYRILGVDIQYIRDQLLGQFEQGFARHALEKVVQGFSPDQRSKYENFTAQEPKPTIQQGAQFLVQLCGRPYLENLAAQEARTFAREYLEQMLKEASEAQKIEVRAVVQDALKRLSTAAV